MEVQAGDEPASTMHNNNNDDAGCWLLAARMKVFAYASRQAGNKYILYRSAVLPTSVSVDSESGGLLLPQLRSRPEACMIFLLRRTSVLRQRYRHNFPAKWHPLANQPDPHLCPCHAIVTLKNTSYRGH